ncbi:MAG TPA: isoprenylcysteine carboxylmethyltransferase family protein [Bryobacteraceae bacterium]|nr:isoprenylcysteine carboxylmethyltransferase family protein [Bryobacteraceae bacterium]
MRALAWVQLAVLYIVWWYPFIFRAPHRQKRPSVTVPGPSRIGLLLETVALFVAWIFQISQAPRTGAVYLLISLAVGVIAVLLAWGAVSHLGRQFRLQAGLYQDHELVQTGPYGVVRHPIYSSLLALMVSTMILVTQWKWAIVAVVIFVVGTEIRVHTEEKLLASRFSEKFAAYKKRVPAYLPPIR